MILGNESEKHLLEIAIESDIPVLLVGETGTGKNSLIRELAERHSRPVTRFSMTGETSVDEFVGKYILQDNRTEWQDGVLLQSLKRGDWLVVDEVNVALPEILFVLQSLLDDDKSVMVANHDGETIRPHSDFRFFATMNPVDEYAGTKDLNKSFTSRFGMVLNIRYPEAKIERQIVTDRTKLSETEASKIVDVGVAIRKAKAENKVFYTCSTRDLLHWAALVPRLGLQKSFEATILHKAMSETATLTDIYATVVGRYDALPVQTDSLIDYVEAGLKRIETAKEEIRVEILHEIHAQLNKPAKKTVKKRKK
jgi:midasin (ATPase involved in ribosome maturation)